MSSDLLPNFLPVRPHAFWIFLGVSLGIFLASFGLKMPVLAQKVTTYWHQENPVALADFSACPATEVKNLPANFARQFPSWHLIPLSETSFRPPSGLKEKTDSFFSLSPKTEYRKNLASWSSVEKYLSQSCAKAASFATLPETDQQEMDLKSGNLEENALAIAHFLEISGTLLLCLTLIILGKARFKLSLPRLIFLSESTLSAFKISFRTLKKMSFALFLGLGCGILLSEFTEAYFSAHFFNKSFSAIFLYALKSQISALAHLTLTPDFHLIVNTLILYYAVFLFFLWRLHQKLKKRRQTRIFLSDNNPFT